MKDVFVVAYEDDLTSFVVETEFDCSDEAHAYEMDLGSKGIWAETFLRFYD